MNFMTSISFCDVMLLWASYLLLEDSAAQTIHLAEFNKSACKTDCTQGLQSFTYKCQFTSIVKMENSGFENGDLTLLFKNEITGKFEPLSSVQRLQDCDDFSNRSDYTCFRHDTKMFNISMYVKTNLLYEGAEVKFKIIINTNTTVYSNARHVIGLTDMPDPSHVAGYLTVNGQSALINECNIKIAGEHLEINFKCHAFTKECAIQMDINGGQEIKYSTNSIEFNQTLMVASEVNVHIKFSACTLDENVTSFNCTFKPGTLDKSSPVETTTIIIATSAVGSLIVIICIICIAICVRYLKKKKGNTKSQPRGQQEGASSIPEQEQLLQQTETKTGKGSLLEDIDGEESGQLEDTCFIDVSEDTYSLDESSDKAGNEQSVSSLSDNSREDIIFEKNNIQGFIQSQAIVNDLLDNNARRLDEDFVGNEEAFSSPSADSPLNHSLTIVNDSMQDNVRKLAKECVEEHLENKLSKGKLVIDPNYLKKFGPCFYESLKKIWKKGSVIVKEDVRHKREFQQIDDQDIDLLIKMANKFMGNFILNSESEKEQKEDTDIFQIGHDFNDYIIRFTTMLIHNFQETLRKDHQYQKSVETSSTFPEKSAEDCTINKKSKSIKEMHGNQIKRMVRIFTEPERKEQTGHKSVELCQLIQDNSEKDYTIKQKVSDIKEKHGTQLMKMADLFTEHLKVGKEDQKEEKEYTNAAATNEQLAQHMSLLEFPCVNSQNHNIFVSVKEFKRDHLPSLYRVGELYDLIMLSASLTVKVLVTSTSNERDGDSRVPTITNLTDFEKEIKAIRRGTGRVIHVQKNLDGDNQRCPCHECKISSTPNPVQGNIYICTSKKIIYDDKEAENSKCILDFAFRNCETISLSGSGNNGFRVSKDCCVLMYQTCNHNLLQHLEAKINEYNNVYDKVHHTFKGSSEKHRLAVIVSNPHGFSKQVSVGEWVEKKNKCANTYYYTYNTLACEGSVGAHVFILGSSSSVLFNQHIHLGKENETELNHSCVNTSIREFNLC